MKATQGALRLDQSYEYVSSEYNGKYKIDDMSLPVACCENCGKPISNIATVKGTVDGREYRIGLDCAATLVGITPDTIAQAKKQMAKEAKFRKWIFERMNSWIEIDGVVYLFEIELCDKDRSEDFVTSRYVYRCNPNKYANALPIEKKRVVVDKYTAQSSIGDWTYEALKFGNA